MSGDVARNCLNQELTSWRKNHPPGFVAKPEILEDGSVNLLLWNCIIPGKVGTDWQGGFYPLRMHFSEEYPSKPPKCKFPQGFLHFNVFPSGCVSLPILRENCGWAPAFTVKQILFGIQDLLDQPNWQDPKQTEGYSLFTKGIAEYKRRVRQQAKQYPVAVNLTLLEDIGCMGPKSTTSVDIACRRLSEERNLWRRNHPPGFVAKPETFQDGSVNLLLWNCVIPGKVGTDWQGGFYPLTMHFSEEYPSKPPKCSFPRGFLHPNVYPDGTVLLRLLSEDCDWAPAVTVKQIFFGIQDLLDQPNWEDPQQTTAYHLLNKDITEYKRRVRLQAKQYPAVVNLTFLEDSGCMVGPNRAIGDGGGHHEDCDAMMDEDACDDRSSSINTISRSSKKRQKRDHFTEAVNSVAESLKNYVDARLKTTPTVNGLEVYDEVCKVRGILRPQILRAVKMFLDSPRYFELLKDLPEERKLDWILLCLGDSSR